MRILILCSLLFPLAARPLARTVSAHVEPRLATWLMTCAALLLAGTSCGALGLLVLSPLVRMPWLARLGHWSSQIVDDAGLPGGWTSLVAAVALGAAVLAMLTFIVRRARALADVRRHARSLPGGGELIVTGDSAADAYAVPGRPGRIVVSTGMLDVLDDTGRTALLAHERAHLSGRHHWFTAAARLAASANPLVRPLAAAVDFTVERWADESAASAVGDRQLVARAIASAAIAAKATRAPKPKAGTLGILGAPRNATAATAQWLLAHTKQLLRPDHRRSSHAARILRTNRQQQHGLSEPETTPPNRPPSTSTTRTLRTSRQHEPAELETTPPAQQPSSTTTRFLRANRQHDHAESDSAPPGQQPSTTTTRILRASRQHDLAEPETTPPGQQPSRSAARILRASRRHELAESDSAPPGQRPSTSTTRILRASRQDEPAEPETTPPGRRPSRSAARILRASRRHEPAELDSAPAGWWSLGGVWRLVRGRRNDLAGAGPVPRRVAALLAPAPTPRGGLPALTASLIFLGAAALCAMLAADHLQDLISFAHANAR